MSKKEVYYDMLSHVCISNFKSSDRYFVFIILSNIYLPIIIFQHKIEAFIESSIPESNLHFYGLYIYFIEMMISHDKRLLMINHGKRLLITIDYHNHKRMYTMSMKIYLCHF